MCRGCGSQVVAAPPDADRFLGRSRGRGQRVHGRAPAGDVQLGALAHHLASTVEGVGGTHVAEVPPEVALSVADRPDERHTRSDTDLVHPVPEAGDDVHVARSTHLGTRQPDGAPVVVEQVVPAGDEVLGLLAGLRHAHPLGARGRHHVAVAHPRQPGVVRLAGGQVHAPHAAAGVLAHAVLVEAGARRVVPDVRRRLHVVGRGAVVRAHVGRRREHIRRHEGITARVDRCHRDIAAAGVARRRGGGGRTRAREERRQEHEQCGPHWPVSPIWCSNSVECGLVWKERWLEPCSPSIPLVPPVKQFLHVLSIWSTV